MADALPDLNDPVAAEIKTFALSIRTGLYPISTSDCLASKSSSTSLIQRAP